MKIEEWVGVAWKLSPSDVDEIRRARRRGESVKSLAEQFGVSMSTVSAVACGRRYRSGEPPLEPHQVYSTQRRDPMFEAACAGVPWEQARRMT